jgi:hypothetical protein
MAKKSKKDLKSYLFVLLGVLLASVIFFTKDFILRKQTVQDIPSKKVELLLLQQSESGKLTPDENNPNSYTLTLTDLSDRIILFTDRPNRSAGSIAQDEYIQKFWETSTENSFKQDPPNAVLTSYDPNTNQVSTIVLELQKPVYNRELDTLQYDAKLIGSERITLNTTTNIYSFPENLISPVLYIDIASEDIVMDGGGQGKGSTPFQFQLENRNE